ncbi:unnamed protein product, partial [Ceratitis capitata]
MKENQSHGFKSSQTHTLCNSLCAILTSVAECVYGLTVSQALKDIFFYNSLDVPRLVKFSM